MFVFESTIMGFLGGICGIFLGIIGSKIFNFILNLIATNFGGSAVNIFYFPLWFLGFILFSATAVGFFTGIIPAKRASSIDPLEALRYK
jgi:putative ABC transport system permease protein